MTILTIDRPAATVTTDPPVVPVQADPDTLVIVVRQEHIDRGVRRRSDLCPIALAAQETTGDRYAAVGGIQLIANDVSWTGSWEVAEFTCTFDAGFRVRPDIFYFKRSVWRSA